VNADTPQRILLIAEGQVGDLLLLTPSIRGLHRHFPSSSLSVLIVDRRDAGENEPGLITTTSNRILSRNPAIDELYSVRRDRLSGERGLRRVRAELEVVAFIRRKKFDAVISTFPQDRFTIWAFLSGASRRIGEANGLFRWLLTDRPSVRKGSGSVALYYAAIAGLLGGPVDPLPTEYFLSREGEEWGDRFLSDMRLERGKFVLLHPGATGAYKIWPPGRFAELADRLVEELKVAVVLCGGPADRSLVDEIREGTSGKDFPVFIEPAIDRFASLACRSALLISNDSGPRHIGVAVGTPTLSLFRSHHDREWAVYPESSTNRIIRGKEECPLCPEGACLDRIPEGEDYGSACLRSIRTDQVVREVVRMLGTMEVSR